MTEPEPFSKIQARFKPRRTDNLRPVALGMIGMVFELEWAGVGGDDEPYPGQSRWMIARKHDAELPEDARGLWFPREDLEIVTQSVR